MWLTVDFYHHPSAIQCIHCCNVPITFAYIIIIITTGESGTACSSGTHGFTFAFSGSYCSIFGFVCRLLQITVCHFVYFQLATVLSVLLRFTLLITPLVSSSFFTIHFVPGIMVFSYFSLLYYGNVTFTIENQICDQWHKMRNLLYMTFSTY